MEDPYKRSYIFLILTAAEMCEITAALYLSVTEQKFAESEQFITATKVRIVGSFHTTCAAVFIGLGSLLLKGLCQL